MIHHDIHYIVDTMMTVWRHQEIQYYLVYKTDNHLNLHIHTAWKVPKLGWADDAVTSMLVLALLPYSNKFTLSICTL